MTCTLWPLAANAFKDEDKKLSDEQTQKRKSPQIEYGPDVIVATEIPGPVYHR